MTFSRFEDLPVWKSARLLTKSIYTLTGQEIFSKDFRLIGQLRSSAVSIMSNIAEGFESQSLQQFKRYLSIAKGSAGELRSLLYVCEDNFPIDKEEFNMIMNRTKSISKQCFGLINYLDEYESGNKVRESETLGTILSKYPSDL